MLTLIFLLGFPFVIWHVLKTIRTAKASVGWSTAAGVVTGSTRKKVAWTQQPRVTYAYEVNGLPFSGERISFAGSTPGGEVDAVLGRYPLHQAVTVYFAPTDPGQCVLEPGASRQVYAPLRSYLTIFVVLVVLNGLGIGLRLLKTADAHGTARVPTYGDLAVNDPDYGDKLILQGAQNGDARDQCSMGKRYLTGYKVTQDMAAAAKWFRKAADQGDAEAQERLGVLYGRGAGVEKNYPEAMALFRKAAAQGNKLACVDLGYIYDKGYGVPVDHREAVRWYGEAKGNLEADMMIARLGLSTTP